MSHLRAIKLGLHWNNESRQCPYRLIKHLSVVAWVSSSGQSTEWSKIIRAKSMGHRAAMIFDWISKEIWTWWTLQLMTDVSFFEIVISFSRTFIRNLDLLFWRRTNFEALFFGELYFQRIKNQLIPILVHAELLYELDALCASSMLLSNYQRKLYVACGRYRQVTCPVNNLSTYWREPVIDRK